MQGIRGDADVFDGIGNNGGVPELMDGFHGEIIKRDGGATGLRQQRTLHRARPRSLADTFYGQPTSMNVIMMDVAKCQKVFRDICTAGLMVFDVVEFQNFPGICR